MVNVTHPELKETLAPTLPTAELETLKRMREELSKTKDFKLQPQQRFLRRVMSPESSVRSLLMVHGTGTGKTCTAIQIAEEYVIRPEFQTKKVLMIASPAVKQNFKDQIFDVTKAISDEDGVLLSKQCTGRRYLETIQRAQSEPLRMTDRGVQEKVKRMADKLLGEFYEFFGYEELSILIDNNQRTKTPNDFTQWIHDMFDNRLIIIDEAHNIKTSTETTITKQSANAIQMITKLANGVTLVLLTATPMYNEYDEILFYFSLFLWNERKLDTSKVIQTSEIFDEKGNFKEGQEVRFRGWCQDYVSYLKGDNPFTFPFRLPPPDDLVAPANKKYDHDGNKIINPRKYLKLAKSFVSPYQEKYIRKLKIQGPVNTNTICTLPDGKSFRETFEGIDIYSYRKGVDNFLAPSKVGLYSSKFALVLNIILNSKGVVFVYSNSVEIGTNLFAMCLEEHGFENAGGSTMLGNPSGEAQKGTRGKYLLFTGDATDAELNRSLDRVKDPRNLDGSDVRVVIASKKVSEGVDFRFVRQVHILDPWYNMSRIEQILGRGMRTFSHASLPFEYQNCTVYLHVCVYPNSDQETIDETIYRVYSEDKAIKIAKVKRVIMESAMDCDLQQGINNLPEDWRNLKIPQIRAQDNKELKLTLFEMSAPTFEDTITDIVCRTIKDEEDKDHIRPLSAILDIRDEVFDKLLVLFSKKPIWKLKDLYSQPSMRQYSKDVLDYLIQNSIESQFKFKSKDGRVGKLESRDGVLTMTFTENDTMVEKTLQFDIGKIIQLPEGQEVESIIKEDIDDINIIAKREAYEWPDFAREFDDFILDWFILDNVLKPAERIKHLLSVDWTNPPIYAKPLVIYSKQNKPMYILGSKKIYNENKELIEPVGEERDLYNKWLSNVKDKYVKTKETVFASMKNYDTLIFNIENDPSKIEIASRDKNIGGRSCITIKQPVLRLFVEWVTGSPVPEKINGNQGLCLFLDLVIRRAIVQGKEGLMWITPQEYDIINNELDNKKEVMKRFK
jgi:superfamily II DNA or RNA helicase